MLVRVIVNEQPENDHSEHSQYARAVEHRSPSPLADEPADEGKTNNKTNVAKPDGYTVDPATLVGK